MGWAAGVASRRWPYPITLRPPPPTLGAGCIAEEVDGSCGGSLQHCMRTCQSLRLKGPPLRAGDASRVARRPRRWVLYSPGTVLYWPALRTRHPVPLGRPVRRERSGVPQTAPEHPPPSAVGSVNYTALSSTTRPI
jgi:hypothetical protein